MEKRAADQDFRSINFRLSIRVHGQFYSSAKPTPLLRVFASPPPSIPSPLDPIHHASPHVSQRRDAT